MHPYELDHIYESLPLGKSLNAPAFARTTADTLDVTNSPSGQVAVGAPSFRWPLPTFQLKATVEKTELVLDLVIQYITYPLYSIVKEHALVRPIGAG